MRPAHIPAGIAWPELLRQPQVDRIQPCRFSARCDVLGAQAGERVNFSSSRTGMELCALSALALIGRGAFLLLVRHGIHFANASRSTPLNKLENRCDAARNPL
jgi:hypothetical protein